MTIADQQPQAPSGNGGQDLALKRAIETAYRGRHAPAQGSPMGPQASDGGPEDSRVAHGLLLLRAAGVASAELVAHRDTWEWLAALAVEHGHFRTPPSVEDVKEGRIRTVLSGRSLIALLIELWNTRSRATPLEGDWALATTSYNRIEAELASVTGQGETIRIVLDDGMAHGTGESDGYNCRTLEARCSRPRRTGRRRQQPPPAPPATRSSAWNRPTTPSTLPPVCPGSTPVSRARSPTVGPGCRCTWRPPTRRPR